MTSLTQIDINKINENIIKKLESLTFIELNFRKHIPQYKFNIPGHFYTEIVKSDLKGYDFLFSLGRKLNGRYFGSYNDVMSVFYNRLFALKNNILNKILEIEASDYFKEQRFLSLKDNLKDDLKASIIKFRKYQGMDDSDIKDLLIKCLKEIKVEEILE